jgi:multidrug transporter EmrE-like cation transporter
MISSQLSSYFYVLISVTLTVYSQIINKWQVSNAGALPEDLVGKLTFLLRLLLNPWVLSTFVGAFIAGLAWLAALSKLPLGYAYPVFVSLTFVGVIGLSTILFQEVMTLPRAIAMGLIIAGIIIGSQG